MEALNILICILIGFLCAHFIKDRVLSLVATIGLILVYWTLWGNNIS